MTDRWASRNPSARAWVQMTGLAVAAPFLAILAATGSMFVLIAALIAFGLGADCSTAPPCRSCARSPVPSAARPAIGILNLAGRLAGGIGAAAAGWMKQSLGLTAAFELAAIILIAGAFSLRNLPLGGGLLRWT